MSRPFQNAAKRGRSWVPKEAIARSGSAGSGSSALASNWNTHERSIPSAVMSARTASSTVPRSSPITAAPFLAASMATTARSSSSR